MKHSLPGHFGDVLFKLCVRFDRYFQILKGFLELKVS